MHMFFPGSSGAPTPGIIGEFYVNYNILCFPLIWLYGFLSSAFSYRFWPRGSAVSIVSYSIIVSFFFLIVTKVDTSLIDNLIFWIAPFWAAIVALSLLASCTPRYFKNSL